MTGRTIPPGIHAEQVTAAEFVVLCRIRKKHPAWTVTRVEGGMFQALCRRTSGWEHAIYRDKLRDIETELDLIAENKS